MVLVKLLAPLEHRGVPMGSVDLSAPSVAIPAKLPVVVFAAKQGKLALRGFSAAKGDKGTKELRPTITEVLE